ncbi:amylo-alpha-1,6-glucosidase [Deinococcus pimensis]|uniref:amylo-alpha-1,6-glucosidase n=1 Tax=Deinococcus pimensis TaxID=309888 RepID=UPI0004B8BD6F|nr:trehalase family glycosidase [Deinococcus pimensis]
MNLDRVPFSTFGSYLALGGRPRADTPAGPLYLRTLQGDAPRKEVLRLDLLDPAGRRVTPEARLDPTRLTLSTPHGAAELIFDGPRTLRLRARGPSVRLDFETVGWYDFLQQVTPDAWHLNSFSNRSQYRLTRLAGHVSVDAPWHVDRSERIALTLTPGEDPTLELVIEELPPGSVPRASHPDFDDAHARAETAFHAFAAAFPGTPPPPRGRVTAAYVAWSGVLEPRGFHRRPAMVMSKNWMTQVWSWDHCFNAVALAAGHPDLAFDQWLTAFDHQTDTGALPDSVSDGARIFNFVKPPVHGWALRALLERGALGEDRLREAYPLLARWTQWWFEQRDDDHDGVPAYAHGNDSGWDNGSFFTRGGPLESPDLSALLVEQLDVLALVAARLGQDGEARAWKERADALTAATLEHFWTGTHFQPVLSGTHERVPSRSLMRCLPLLIAPRLPHSVREALVRDVTSPEFLTSFGLRTEARSSAAYDPRGYWRGSSWAPATLLVVEGLERAGERALALEVARRFCAAAGASDMPENFDPETGEALCCPAYTWTASVYLEFAGRLSHAAVTPALDVSR